MITLINPTVTFVIFTKALTETLTTYFKKVMCLHLFYSINLMSLGSLKQILRGMLHNVMSITMFSRPIGCISICCSHILLLKIYLHLVTTFIKVLLKQCMSIILATSLTPSKPPWVASPFKSLSGEE